MKRLNAVFSKDLSSVVNEVKDVLVNGGIVGLPTETVYGLAALVANKPAVEKLYKIKQRNLDKPFTLHFANIESALFYFTILPPYAYRLLEEYWPGPLTLVYFSKGKEKIGIRVPRNQILVSVLEGLNQPLYLPSANISGEKEALSADEVEKKFNKDIDLVVDGGAPVYFKPSTVIDLTFHPFKVLREGAISIREIVDVYIKKRIVFVCTGNTCRSIMAEYLLKKYLLDINPYLADRYEIVSRGIFPYEGAPVAPTVVEILKEKEDIKVESHQATRLSRHLVLSSDLIFTMEDRQKEVIIKDEPVAEAKVFNLKKFLPPDIEEDFIDPIAKPRVVYEESFERIKKAVLELIDWL